MMPLSALNRKTRKAPHVSSVNYKAMNRAVTLALLLLAAGCSKTELLNAPEPKVVDTVVVKASRPKPHRPQIDTTRVPIVFDVEVEDWDEKVIEL